MEEFETKKGEFHLWMAIHKKSLPMFEIGIQICFKDVQDMFKVQRLFGYCVAKEESYLYLLCQRIYESHRNVFNTNSQNLFLLRIDTNQSNANTNRVIGT